MKVRNYKIDMIKGVLIWCVVLGHLLELVIKAPAVHALYVMIYTFHMPLFVFTTGYFARFSMKKLLCHIALPYIVFSGLYQICALFWWKDLKVPSLLTPYWLLWYLLAVFAWSITIPLWVNVKGAYRFLVITVFVILALVAGNYDVIGRTCSASRILVFFPFFVAGTYWHQAEPISLSGYSYSKYITRSLSVLLLVLSVLILWNHQNIHYTWLYEATSYERSHYDIGIRAMHLLIAGFFVCCAMLLPSVNKDNLFTKWGQNTMPVFLWHGFLIKALKSSHLAEILNLQQHGILSICLCVFLATGIVAGITRVSLFYQKQHSKHK